MRALGGKTTAGSAWLLFFSAALTGAVSCLNPGWAQELPKSGCVASPSLRTANGAYYAQIDSANAPPGKPRLSYPFSATFKLYVTGHVVDSTNGGWNQDSLNVFTKAALDDGASGPQRFRKIWDYFCYTDLDPSPDRVRYKIKGDDLTISTQTKIEVDLYHQRDIPGSECQGQYIKNTSTFEFAAGCCTGGGNCATPVRPPSSINTNLVFPHELAHLCDYANKAASGEFADLINTELLSTGAEYVSGERWNTAPGTNSLQYDQSLLNNGLNNIDANGSVVPYAHYRMFTAYLFKQFPSSSDTTDLLYRWLRCLPGSAAGVRTSLFGLSTVLSQTPYSQYVPGATGSKKIGTLLHRFGIARFVDDNTVGGGLYGFGTPSSYYQGMFSWPDHNVARVMTMPPLLRLGGNVADGLPRTLDYLLDSVDPIPSTIPSSAPPAARKYLEDCCQEGQWYKPIRIGSGSSDYFVFSADSSYFSSHDDRVLTVKIKGRSKVPRFHPDYSQFHIGYVRYNSYSSDLHGKPVIGVTEDIPLNFSSDTLDTYFQVGGFGKETKSVVVVFSMAPDSLLTVGAAARSWNLIESADGPPLKHNMEYSVTYWVNGACFTSQPVVGASSPSRSPFYLCGADTIQAGQTLEFPNGSDIFFGPGASLEVKGKLIIPNGQLRSASASPTAGDWSGIHVYRTGNLQLLGSGVRDASTGVVFGAGSSGSTGGGLIKSSRFENNRDVDVYVSGPGSSVVLESDTLLCANVSGHVGIQVEQPEVSTVIKNARIRGCAASNAKGMLLRSAVSVLGSRIRDFTGGSARGIVFDFPDSMTVATVDENPGDISTPADSPVIRHCATGIYVTGLARPKIRHVYIDSTSYGFWVNVAASADIGRLGDQGKNWVTSTATKCVYAPNNRIFGIPDPDAYYCYWGSASPPASKFSTHVNWNPYLTTEPYGTPSGYYSSHEDVGAIGDEGKLANGAFPNPFQSRVVLKFRRPKGTAEVDASVFDVAGRLVRELKSMTAYDGDSGQVEWDGRDESNSPVKAGMYYFEILSGGTRVAAGKVLLVR